MAYPDGDPWLTHGLLAAGWAGCQAEYERSIPILATVMEMPEFHGRLPGLHLEGPFLSKEDGAKGVRIT